MEKITKEELLEAIKEIRNLTADRICQEISERDYIKEVHRISLQHYRD